MNGRAAQRLARLQPAYEEAVSLVQRMQRSRFWRLRETLLGFLRRCRLSLPSTASSALEDVPLDDAAPLDRYELWRLEHDVRPADAAWMRAAVGALRLRPRLSILLPTYNTPEEYLRAALDSVLAQIYPDWELCIADDASTDPRVAAVLAEYASADSRIRVAYRASNGHISAASNTALALATGEFIALLDHDDVLAEDALFANALRINARPDVDMLYSDEDKIDEFERRLNPYFKPDWAPETLLSRMYTCHLGVYRTALVRELGGFREGFEGSQDYDLVLRLTERSSAIEHISRILYHWRVHNLSASAGPAVKTYAREAALRALGDALARRGEHASVTPAAGAPGTYVVRYALDRIERVSVVIVARRCEGELVRCLNSLATVTAYGDIETIVVDLTGCPDEVGRAVAGTVRLDEARRPRVAPAGSKSTFAEANAYGASIATGKYLLFLGSEIELGEPEWLTALVEQVQRESVGAAGPKIVFRDGRLNHAGVILGLHGFAGYGHRLEPGTTRGYFNAACALSNVSALSPHCLLLRRELFERSGGFDRQLDAEFGAVDLCLRLTESGYRIVYVPHAVVTIGDERASEQSGTMPAMLDPRQRALLADRWQPSHRFDPYYNPNLTLERTDYSPAP